MLETMESTWETWKRLLDTAERACSKLRNTCGYFSTSLTTDPASSVFQAQRLLGPMGHGLLLDDQVRDKPETRPSCPSHDRFLHLIYRPPGFFFSDSPVGERSDMQQKAFLVALLAPFPCAPPSPAFAQGRPFCSAMYTGPIRGADR